MQDCPTHHHWSKSSQVAIWSRDSYKVTKFEKQFFRNGEEKCAIKIELRNRKGRTIRMTGEMPKRVVCNKGTEFC